MKKVLKITGIGLASLLALVVIIAAYIYFALPHVGAAPELNIERTPQRIARGRYLANSVAACMACHAERDFTRYAGPPDSASFGAGGEKFGREMGFPGNVYSKNITPYALHNWTDGEIYRAIVAGVAKNGTALFPIMPYQRYAQLEPEDVYAIIAYVRTLKPIEKNQPQRELDFPLNFIVNTLPEKPAAAIKIDSNNSVAYGKYLVNAASCIQCHTKKEKGELVAEMAFGGGEAFHMPAGLVYSRNITPDAETGISSWTRAQFIQRFARYRDSTYRNAIVKPADFNTPMPWLTYSTMTDKDLGAIYDYLRTVPPVKNKVPVFQNPM